MTETEERSNEKEMPQTRYKGSGKWRQRKRPNGKGNQSAKPSWNAKGISALLITSDQLPQMIAIDTNTSPRT